MRGQPGFFDVDDRLKRLSDLGDRREAFRTAVEFEMFRPELNAALAYSDGSQGGRPPFDPVMMFKILVMQAANNLSDERAEFLINARLSFRRFLGLAFSARVPDARTIWLFREKLTKAGAINAPFERFDAMLRDAGYIALSGQIVDARLIAAPRQRNTEDAKKAIKEGRIPDAGKDKPAKRRQKDRDARWTVKFTKAKPRADGSPPADLAIPVFGYHTHISIDCGFGLIRKWSATDAAAYEGRLLRAGLLDKTNTASGVWADTAYRPAAKEDLMARNGFESHVHRKKPKGRPIPAALRRGEQRQIEHPLARRACLRRTEGPDGLVHPHDRQRQGGGEDWPRQSRRQHKAVDLLATNRASVVMAARARIRGSRQTFRGPRLLSQCCQNHPFCRMKPLIEASKCVALKHRPQRVLP